MDLAGTANDSTTIAIALTALGNTFRWLGNHDQARRHGEAGLRLKQRLGLDSLLFDSYNSLGLLAWSSDRLQEARELFSKAIDHSRNSHDTVRAKVANNLGLVLTDVGRYREARRLFLEAATAGRTFENPRIEGRALNNLAVLENEVGRPETALPYLDRAGALLRSDPRGEANRLGQMGTVSAALGDPGRGIAWLDSALQIARRLELKEEIATNLEQLADLHLLAGDPRRALSLLQEAAGLNRAMGRSVYLGIDLRREAEIDAGMGDRRQALVKAEQARAIHREAGVTSEELADLVLLADLASDEGDFVRASRYQAEAEHLAAQGDNRRARVAVALTAARVAQRAGQPHRALARLRQAEADFSEESHETLWQVEQVRSLAADAAGDLDGAEAAGRRAFRSVEHMRGRFASPALQSSYLARRAAVYSGLVDLLLRRGKLAEAFEVADAGRGRILQEHLASIATGTESEAGGTVRELAEESAKLLQRLNSLGATLRTADAELDPATRDRVVRERESLQRDLVRARTAYEAALVRSEERIGSRSVLAGAGATTPAIRQALRDDEGILTYLVTPEQVRIFALRPDTILAFSSVVTRASLLAKVRIAREASSRPGSAPGAGDAALADLYRILVGPALEAGVLQGVRRLLLAPHAELQNLPFAALRSPGSGRYLVEDFALIHLPSAGALPALREGRPAAWSPVSATAFAPFPDRLPGSAREVTRFREAIGEAAVRRGKSATEQNLREALRRNTVVHVASHATLNPVNPLFSQVEMAPGRDEEPDNDGRLTVHEVLGLTTRSDLVFLSGCETGSGAAWSTGYDRGEDYATLARAFLYAGAANVIGTLWRIEDEGAAEFAAEFYRRLARGAPADALAGAQRALIGHPRFRGPFYWAPYRLDGGG